jgi:hypothetical protein
MSIIFLRKDKCVTNKKIYGKIPTASRPALISLIVVAALFLAFSAFPVVVSEGDARPYAAIFSLIWFVACICIIYRAVKMLKLIKSGGIEIGEIESGGEQPENSFAKKLRDIESLKKEGLLSDEEYSSKRAEIMKEKW